MLRLFGHYVSKTYLYLGLVEVMVFFLAFSIGSRVRFGWDLAEETNNAKVLMTSAIFAAVMSVAMVSMGLYQRGVQERRAGFVVRLALGFLLGTALLTVVFYAVPSVYIGRGVVGLSLMSAFIGIALTRRLFTRFAGVESRKRRVMVLGAGVNARIIEDLVIRNRNVGFTIVGYVPLPDSQTLVPEEKLIERSGHLLELIIGEEADEIVVAADDKRRKLPVNDLLDCKMSGFDVMDLLTFFEKELAIIKIDLLHPSWIFFSPGFNLGVSGLYGKRLFDIAVGALMLLFSAPIMALVALASLIESKGRDPVFYHQVRVGQNGCSTCISFVACGWTPRPTESLAGRRRTTPGSHA